MGKLNAAIVGCGAIFPIHADAILKSDYANLVAVCDINLQKAKAAGEKYNCSYYEDIEVMLKDKSIDVVHICTPHYLHASMAIRAMENGKHVLTEKPMAMDVAEAEEVLRVSQKTGKSLVVCLQNRFNNTSKRIKSLLESSEVGRPLGIKALVTWNRQGAYYTESGWRGTWDKEGGGLLMNQAIHTLDLMQWFIGDIEKIRGNVDTRLLNDIIEVEDTADATFVFENGVKGMFYATNCYVDNSPVMLEIICEKAVLKIEGELKVSYKNGETLHVTEIDPATKGKAYWGSGHASLIKDFYSRLVNGNEQLVGPEEGIKSLKTIQAIYKSSKTREYVSLS